MWQVEVDQATDAEWSQMLDLFDDANIYQTAPYGQVRWGAQSLSRLVLKRGGEVLGMAQFRIIRPTPLKFGMAYLRWGPLWERRGWVVDPEVPARIAGAIEDEYLKKRKLLVRILPNAFAGSRRADAFHAAFCGFSAEFLKPGNTYRTFVVDLTLSVEEMRSRLDKKWRNQLTRSEKNNLTVISGDGREEFQTFRRIYSEMHRRKGFVNTVQVEEFGQIQQALTEAQRMRVLICMDKSEPVAGVVASAMGNSAIYLLGATSNAGLNAKGAYLLQWTLLNWLKTAGIRSYDLGGIDPEANPGVYHFKKGLSGTDICHIRPFTASDSALSSWMVNVGVFLQRTVKNFGPPNSKAQLERSAAGN